MVVRSSVAVTALIAAAALFAPAATADTLRVDAACRDGLVHGSYELREAGGQLRITGAFNKGRRTGSFLYWSTAGARIAQLPFENDRLSGTVALWHPPSRPGADPRPKLEAAFVDGRPDGFSRSWHANGTLRAEFLYRDRALVEARAFDANGIPLPATEARPLASRDDAGNRDLFASLTAMVREHLPHCDPAGERLEKNGARPAPLPGTGQGQLAPGSRLMSALSDTSASTFIV